MIDISEKSNFRIEQLEVDKDHIHLLIDAMPNISITQVDFKLKQESAVSIWVNFSQMLQNIFLKERTF